MARLFRGLNRLFHDRHWQTLKFKVQLKAGDAFLGAGDLAVHVTEGVFPTHDVGQNTMIGDLAVAIEIGADTDTDTGTRPLHFHTGIHQRQTAATDTRH